VKDRRYTNNKPGVGKGYPRVEDELNMAGRVVQAEKSWPNNGCCARKQLKSQKQIFAFPKSI
jgi:hypothetical protein